MPQYPLSIDNERYQRLIDMLSLYRLTMGQPRQEELLNLLENKNLSSDQISQLMLDLSPINRIKYENNKLEHSRDKEPRQRD